MRELGRFFAQVREKVAEREAALLADIATIQRNSEHLSRLVNDVLDLSHVDSGRMALSKEWTVMQDVVAVAASVVEGLYESKGLFLRERVGRWHAGAVAIVFAGLLLIRG